MSTPEVSVVVPVYGGELTLVPLYDRLAAVFEGMGLSFEVVFVNDASPGNALSVLRDLHARHDNVRVIDLYRNYGQQNALMCGFRYCRGKMILTMDDDLQNPPEEIPLLMARLEEGYDAVIGAPRAKQHAAYKNLGSRAIRAINHMVFKPKKDLRMSSFRLIRRELLDQIKDHKTPFPYVSGMLLGATRNLANVEVEHHPREAGRSGYTLGKLIALSYNLLINYSSLPLKLMGYLGLLVSAFSFVIGTVFIVRKLVLGEVPAGWTSLVVLLSFFFGLLFMMMFVLGEYISRILRELSNERQYSIKEILE
jgi:glycosyltransferase involved in cell wall biosynthesis